ncbi:hypothetical protein NDQ54_15825 [Lactiplantibacillus plantarum]|uniref:hypothetical protein n=4 Tax=Lactiplantibacillus plantarum TaxID=1590 RepID=UPI00203AC17D|nr:hypothetical protein [Lactiplantibacillus plantarum]MCM2587456.1 hypothetical protein [Lactiplantibacillus plantarum]MCM2599874.1 hypothetical protein [Lactiplantibacillus plantarum]MCM2603011.1 hypothetical protein [Lactiplantibacillus plantarum]MCM2610165.1 hypothetical protein [Lactiplantibacillus plantarum]MCM2613473.1 hypothetical protein [Lactiplantibacillus plantarum]
MNQINFSKKLLLVVTFLFSLIVGFNVQSVKADTTNDQIPGQYTAHVTYKNADKPTEDSMIETGGLWDKNVKYTVAANGSADLTIKQDKMINYMAYVKYVGQNSKAQPVDTQKVDNGDDTGSWKARLTRNQATELKTGADITISMQYTVPGLFTHNVDVLMQIDSIDEPDRVAYEQNQKLQQQNQQLQKQLNILQEQIKNNSQLSKLQEDVTALSAQNVTLANSLQNANTQNKKLQSEVNKLKQQVIDLQNAVTDLQKNQQSSSATNSGQPAPKSQTYTATVNYTKPGTNDDSVLNNFFGNKITYVKDIRGNVTVKIPQSKLMDMMNSVTFNGQKMTKVANEWTLNYRGKAADLVAGKQIKIGVSYNLGSSVSTHDAIANIKSISPDGFGTPVKPAPKPKDNQPGTQNENNKQSKNDSLASHSVNSLTDIGTPVKPAPKSKDNQPGTQNENNKQSKNDSLASHSVNSLTDIGSYTAQVSYNKTGANNSDTGQPSMIQSDNLWSRSIKLVKNNDGTVTVTIQQPKMLSYMSSLSFDGVTMQEHKQSDNSGYWTVTLPASKAKDLKVGNKILVSMKYTVPGLFSHDVTALVVINSITTGDPKVTPASDPAANNGESGQVTSTPVGYDQGQDGVPVDGMPVSADPALLPQTVDGMPVSADPALLPQTGEKDHQDNNVLTVGVVMFVVLISGIIGFDIYRRKQNA